MVILAVVCGAELAGIVGVFLSVPVAALLLVCARHWRSLALRDKGHRPKTVGRVE
jgi:predicted PurR-regulated permease PerM